jgi:NADH dehydrogenase
VDKAGRVRVRDDLSVPGHAEVFVIGDLAHLDQPDGMPVPGVAPAAKQMGKHVGDVLLARLRGGDEPPPFRYHDDGSLATIGRMAAVAQFGKLKFSGLPAWIAWLLVHIYFLIGFRNRLAVMLDWAWAYCTHQRQARIVSGTDAGSQD